MRTVSLEMAERLKVAGLQWNPKPGDWYEDGWQGRHLVINSEDVPFKKNMIWLPTLSDLLEWLEGRECLVQTYQGGSAWCHQAHEDGRYYCLIWRKKDVFWDYAREFTANTREDALAKGVLWVLEQEASVRDA